MSRAGAFMFSTNVANRITDLLDDSPSISRSPAQQEASRRNGALSHGPVTDHGKPRSSQNPLRHGLRSQRLFPPGDRSDYERAYRRIYSPIGQGAEARHIYRKPGTGVSRMIPGLGSCPPDG